MVTFFCPGPNQLAIFELCLLFFIFYFDTNEAETLLNQLLNYVLCWDKISTFPKIIKNLC